MTPLTNNQLINLFEVKVQQWLTSKTNTMHYKRISGEYFGEPHAKQVDKVKKARRNLAIVCWTILVFGVMALGFFVWIIVYVFNHQG